MDVHNAYCAAVSVIGSKLVFDGFAAGFNVAALPVDVFHVTCAAASCCTRLVLPMGIHHQPQPQQEYVPLQLQQHFIQHGHPGQSHQQQQQRDGQQQQRDGQQKQQQQPRPPRPSLQPPPPPQQQGHVLSRAQLQSHMHLQPSTTEYSQPSNSSLKKSADHTTTNTAHTLQAAPGPVCHANTHWPSQMDGISGRARGVAADVQHAQPTASLPFWPSSKDRSTMDVVEPYGEAVAGGKRQRICVSEQPAKAQPHMSGGDAGYRKGGSKRQRSSGYSWHRQVSADCVSGSFAMLENCQRCTTNPFFDHTLV